MGVSPSKVDLQAFALFVIAGVVPCSQNQRRGWFPPTTFLPPVWQQLPQLFQADGSGHTRPLAWQNAINDSSVSAKRNPFYFDKSA